MLSGGHQARQHCLLIPGILGLLATISNDFRTEAVFLPFLVAQILSKCSGAGREGVIILSCSPLGGPSPKSSVSIQTPNPVAVCSEVDGTASPHPWTTGRLPAALAGLRDQSLL